MKGSSGLTFALALILAFAVAANAKHWPGTKGQHYTDEQFCTFRREEDARTAICRLLCRVTGNYNFISRVLCALFVIEVRNSV